MTTYVLPIAPQTEAEPARMGQKAVGLLRMRQLALPVPPGVVLPSGLWREIFLPSGEPTAVGQARDRFLSLWPTLWSELQHQLSNLLLGAAGSETFAPDRGRPSVFSVRGGAAQSMPGMLTSILNVGLSTEGLPAFAAWAGSRRFALDCYCRFLQGFCQALLSVAEEGGTGAASAQSDWLASSMLGNVTALARRDAQHEPPPSDAALVSQAQKLRAELTARTGVVVPDDLSSQLCWAIWGVLRSTDSARTRDYRRLYGLPADLGTAVVVQAMVYGNLDERSATGVLFTRDPSTGAARVPSLHAPSTHAQATTGAAPYGEFLLCAQGEDVVSGAGTPHPLSELEAAAPTAYAQLLQHADLLERRLGDMQDIEFTIERGQLWLLQARTGKRSAQAMVRIAADLVREGILAPAEALSRVDAGRLVELLHPTIAKDTPRTLVARGLPASPGVAIGPIALSSAEVEAQVRAGAERPPILVRVDTSPDDIVGIRLSAGVLTARGGLTSHAAVVARGLGRCAVVGTGSLQIDARAGTVQTREHSLTRGDILTLDGHTGEVLLGEVPLSVANLKDNQALHALLKIAEARRRMRVYASIDRLADLKMAESLSAEGWVLRRPSLLLGPQAESLRGSPLLTDRPGVIWLPARDPGPVLDAARRIFSPSRAAELTFLWPAHTVAMAERSVLLATLSAELSARFGPSSHSRLGLLLASTEMIAAAAADQLLPMLSGMALLAITATPPDWHRSQGPALIKALAAMASALPGLAVALCDSEVGSSATAPAAVAFCESEGFAFHSGPPLRLPLLAIAAAQAAMTATPG